MDGLEIKSRLYAFWIYALTLFFFGLFNLSGQAQDYSSPEVDFSKSGIEIDQEGERIDQAEIQESIKEYQEENSELL